MAVKKRQEMPLLPPEQRSKSFEEVSLGYSHKDALYEAQRCLNCKNAPCISGCPVNINIPSFIDFIKKGDFEGAYSVISESSSLPAVCGRVCPQEHQCEKVCTLCRVGEPIAIGRLERFAADTHNANNPAPQKMPERKGKSVAVIGSGPAGLACAGDLAKDGYDVTVFEALHTAGGVLVYGIPQFRLPKEIVAREVENLKALGVKIETNVIIGKTLTVDELLQDFSAVFIGSGAGLPSFMGIEGETLNGVYSANEFLTRANLMKAYKKDSATPINVGETVAVVGGGNVAMDAARTALRLGAGKVYIVYRRTLAELPARREEVEHAQEEGVEMLLLCSPVKISGFDAGQKRGFVKSLVCEKMELGQPDERGRRRPVRVPNSEFEIPVDTVIMAIGTTPNPLIKSTTEGLCTNERGGIITDEHGKTSKVKVFAGGDAVTGAATVISAMGAGKVAAKAIREFLSKETK